MTSPQENKNDSPDLEDIFSPIELGLLNQIAAVIQFQLRSRKKESPKSTGFSTNMVTREIFFDPDDVKKMEAYRAFAFFSHELGHHFPVVAETDKSFRQLYPLAMQLLPEALPNKAKFCHSVSNILLDVLLEDSIPRHGEIITRDLFKAAFRQNRGVTFLENAENPDQWLEEFEKSDRQVFPWEAVIKKDSQRISQMIGISLIAPFFAYPDASLLNPDVAVYLDDLKNLFAELTNPKLKPNEKAHVYIQVIKIASALLEKDLDEAVEKAVDIEKILLILWEKLSKLLKNADKVSIQLVDGTCSDGPSSVVIIDEHNIDPGIKLLLDNMAAKLDIVQKSQEDDDIEEKARLYSVRPEIYRLFLGISEKYGAEIASLRDTFIKFILRDYRKQMVRGRKEGQMVGPGREVETYQRLLGGETCPATYLDRVNRPSPRSLQLYNLVDTSGSMVSDLEGTLAYYTIVTVAAKQIHDELRSNPARYDLKKIENDPVEIELVGFDSKPQLIISLAKRLTMYDLMQGFQAMHDNTIRGGGTDDARALKFEHSRMKLHKGRVLKILSMITDGGGQGDRVESILRQIEEDPGIYFFVNGVGAAAGMVKKFYADKFRPAYYYHVFAEESDNVEQAIPKLINFIRDSVKRHYSKNSPAR